MTTSTTKTGAELAVGALEALGVHTVFGIPGVHTLALYDALGASGIRHVLARHEQGIGFMADGFARASGQPGVAFVITGPGVTNIATPLGQAYTDSSPVLTIASNNRRAVIDGMRGSLHDLKDQMGVLRAVTKTATRVTAAADAGWAVAAAYASMMTDRPLPVAVEFPLDVLDEQVKNVPPVLPFVKTRRQPDAEAINTAVEKLKAVKRTVLYVGGGAVSSDAGTAITAISEALNAPILTSNQGKGAVPDDHPNVAGSAWGADNALDALLQEADCLLVIGSRLGAQATSEFAMKFPREVIRIDVDPVEMTLNVQPTLSIVSDAAVAAGQIAERLAGYRHEEGGYSAARIAEARAAAEADWYHTDRRPWVEAVRSAIARDGILVTDMTQMAYVSCGLYPVYEPRTFLFPNGYGTLGFGLPAAIGAKIACPDKQVVCMVGDGGFQYTMGELGVAVQERVGLPIVLFNDNTYSAVKEAQKWERGGRYKAVDLVNPSFLGIAKAYGIEGVLAETPEALTAAIAAAYGRDLPTIIEVPTEQWV